MIIIPFYSVTNKFYNSSTTILTLHSYKVHRMLMLAAHFSIINLQQLNMKEL
jgi:hypothetical protein